MLPKTVNMMVVATTSIHGNFSSTISLDIFAPKLNFETKKYLNLIKNGFD